MNSILTISLDELVYSGLLSHDAFYFGSEAENFSNGDHQIEQNSEERQRLLRSAKVSLTLAKAYSQLVGSNYACDEEVANKNYPSRLRLGDVFVTLECSSEFVTQGATGARDGGDDQRQFSTSVPTKSHTYGIRNSNDTENLRPTTTTQYNAINETALGGRVASDSSLGELIVDGFSDILEPITGKKGHGEKIQDDTEDVNDLTSEFMLSFFDADDASIFETNKAEALNDTTTGSTNGTCWTLPGMETFNAAKMRYATQHSVDESLFQPITDYKKNIENSLHDFEGKNDLPLEFISRFFNAEDSNESETRKNKNINEYPKFPTDGIRWTLLGMEIIPPETISVDESSYNLLPMQILGNLCCSIFLLDETLLPFSQEATSCYEKKDACLNVEEIGSSSPPSSKLQRNIGQSMFARLLETCIYPVSVCRLLSDMIDIGVDGKADSPFNSVDEVIQDLTQMTNDVRC